MTSMKRYNPADIETKWQKKWSDEQIYAAKDFDKKPKFTMLTEFPYPSGAAMHMGHLREYTYGDIIARNKRMRGFNVLFPMGFDAFGLPTENFAIKNKVTPQSATESNTANFRRQLDSMGYSIDWSRSFATSDPEYYRWTQWLFLQFFKTGMAFQDEIAINWCPFCKTGLANEEVINGRHERCDNLVEKKVKKQWMLRITDYADRLIDGLETVDYPSRIADQQINWIGKSTGAEVDFILENGQKITVFTTRPDTLFGATFMVLAPEHPMVKDITTEQQRDKINEYIKIAQSKSDIERQENKEKTGVFTGAYAINPVNDEKIPIWIADYVLTGYGTGAIMAVPAHDERDNEFAKKFGVSIKPVVLPRRIDVHIPINLMSKHSEIYEIIKDLNPHPLYSSDGTVNYRYDNNGAAVLALYKISGLSPNNIYGSGMYGENINEWTDDTIPVTEEGILTNSGEFDGMTTSEAKEKIIKWLDERGTGREKVNYNLRDWIFSRQHYWGEPIPIIHCSEHGAVAVPDDQLPVELPIVDHYEPTDDGESPLSLIEDWVNTTCPTCGKPAKRETDTMPNWAGSNWYYLRYYDAHNNEKFADEEKLKYWGAVDLYLGGMEHTTLHLLYSRFHHQFLYDQGLVPTPEPYAARRGQGIILAADGRKMSKSLGNVVNPTEIIEAGYGADACRLTVAFLAPYDQTTPWSPETVAGTYRFLGRVWSLAEATAQDFAKVSSDDVKKIVTRATKKVSDDIENMQFNTAIATLMEALNGLSKVKPEEIALAEFATFTKLLAPFAPHLAEEIWQELLGEKNSIHVSTWPEYDAKYLEDDEITIGVQVNGKLRGEITVAKDADKSDIEKLALNQENVAKFIGDKSPTKVIYVPNKIVNIVVK